MPWLTPVVFKQAPDEALVALPRFDDGPRKVRFRHVVHAYSGTSRQTDLAVQSITFATMDLARRFAESDYDTSCVVVAFPEDVGLIPTGAVAGHPLARDVSAVGQFKVQRRLPLLFDILRSGVEATIPNLAGGPTQDLAALTCLQPRGGATDAPVEFVVLTNSDIHLQPTFYRVLGALITQGYDVITVNRRTLAADPASPPAWPLLMADRGRNHQGFDCFVFPMSLFSDLVECNCCCGIGYVMRGLLFNLVAHAHRFLMLTQAQLTFHLGNDQAWNDPTFSDYVDFNIAEVTSVISTLSQDADKARRLVDFIRAHEGLPFSKIVPAIS